MTVPANEVCVATSAAFQGWTRSVTLHVTVLNLYAARHFEAPQG
jgi:hypothetical protein